MGFKLPTFNLLCNFGDSNTFGPPIFGPARVTGQACQLCYGRRVSTNNGIYIEMGAVSAYVMSLLLPPLVDIRSPQQMGGGNDTVEVPAGSGRWYSVSSVDDIGKGFANEHRTAFLVALAETWTVPFP